MPQSKVDLKTDGFHQRFGDLECGSAFMHGGLCFIKTAPVELRGRDYNAFGIGHGTYSQFPHVEIVMLLNISLSPAS